MWQKYTVVRLALPFLCGMCGAAALMGRCTWRTDMLFVVMCCLLMATVVCHRAAAHAPLFRHVFAASVAGLFLLLGATLYIIRYNNVVASIDVQQTSFCGTVTGMPQPKPRTVAVQVRLDDGGLMLAYVQSDTAHSPHQLQTGDTLFFSPLHVNSTCPLTLSDTSVFRNYNSNLFFRGIAATCYVPSDRWTHTSPAQRDATWNERLHRYYAQSPLDSVTFSMVEALTIGRREGLSRQLRADYSTAGVSHVLALSGMHLHLLIALLNLLIFSFLTYGHRRFAMLAVIPLLWMFTYVAGAPPSLVRAAVMATFLQIGFACGRVYFVLNALALAAIVMLTYDPLVLHNVGFQLSFLSMLGIALLFKQFYLSTSPSAKATMPHIPLWMRLLSPLIRVIMMTFSTTLFTAPLVAYHFGQLPVFGLLTNLIVPFLTSLLMYASVAWLLLFFWPAAQAVVGTWLDALVSGQNKVVETIASWPASHIDFRPSALVTLLLYAALCFVLCFSLRRKSSAFPRAHA